MLQYRLVRYSELSSREIALWDRLQRGHVEFESPYFRPEFTQAVAAVRDDVEVAVIEELGKPVGFFPFQRGTMNLGKPVAGKLNDFHGVIVPRGFRVDARQLVEACRLASWDYEHFVGDQPSFESFNSGQQPAPYLDMPDGFAAYCEERKASGTEMVRKTQSRERKFEREVGPLRFELDTQRREALDTLIAWKVAQFQRTEYMNLFDYPWTENLLRKISNNGTDGLSALLSVLWSGDRPIAISYMLRSHAIAHCWFIAYDTELSTYSPGMIMMLRMAEQAAETGVKRIHLGTGDQRFKQSLGSGHVTVTSGTIDSPRVSTIARDAWRWGRHTVRTTPWLAFLRETKNLLQPLRSWLAFK